ncbi:MAG TPA: hypothetical protein VFD70_08145 [Anaerolineae bacterium]|nr:hypothetical protein [Anaerolineae bacterium]
MTEEQDQSTTKSYSITFSLDRGKFFRRACSSCGRHFKTEASDAELAHILQPVFSRIDAENKTMKISDGQVNEAATKTIMYCPYCGHHDDSGEMLTIEFQEYLKRYAYREIVFPQIRQMFSGLSDSFRQNRGHSRGLFSVQVKFEASDDTLPPRPIAGPEPPDMLKVKLHCCGKRAKILDGWYGSISCPYCGTNVIPL